MVIGIDVGGTTVKFGLVKLNGELVSQKRIDTAPAANGIGLVEAMIEEVKIMVAEDDSIEGVGIGFPGLVSKDRRSVIHLPNIPQVKEQDVIAKFKSALPNIKVKIENDAKCAAIGELQFGKAKGLDSYLFVTLGTGVGGGFVLDGQLFLGAKGNATEVGHMYTPIEGKTVEEHLGLGQIIEYAKKMLNTPEFENSNLKGQEITPKAIYEEAINKDALALHVWEHVGTVLGYGLISMMRFADVSKFVIGGGVSGAFDMFIGTTEKIIKENLPAYYYNDLEFRRASVGEHAGILGAASLIYHSYGE